MRVRQKPTSKGGDIYPDLTGDMTSQQQTDLAQIDMDGGAVAEPLDDVFDHIYDEGFGHGVAGHVEAAAVGLDGAVNTPTGYDIGWEGERGYIEDTSHMDAVGSSYVDEMIGETVENARAALKRVATTSAAKTWRADTWTLLNAVPLLIADRNNNRRSIVVTNQSTTAITLYASPNPLLGPAGCCAIPQGASRTFDHMDRVWVSGATGAIVDIMEENFTDA